MTHYCECYCCLLLILWSLSRSVLMIVWTLPLCYHDLLSILSPAGMLFLAVASPLFWGDANAPVYIMNTDGGKRMSSIQAYSSVVCMLYIVVTVNEHWEPCSAIYSPHCVYFKQLLVVSYSTAPLQQHSLSFISALLIMYIVKWIFSILSEGFRKYMSDFLIPHLI